MKRLFIIIALVASLALVGAVAAKTGGIIPNATVITNCTARGYTWKLDGKSGKNNAEAVKDNNALLVSKFCAGTVRVTDFACVGWFDNVTYPPLSAYPCLP